jgi:hypothetical protein
MVMSWIDYGFPDVTMRSSYLPAKGIELALRERDALGNSSYIPGMQPVHAFESFLSHVQDYRFMHAKFKYLFELSPRYCSGSGYINHLNNYSTHPDVLTWGDTNLAEAISARDEIGGCLLQSGIAVYPYSSDIAFTNAQWLSKDLLRQQYIKLNLLKVPVVPVKFVMKQWFTNGTYPTPMAAWNAAVAEGPKPYTYETTRLAFSVQTSTYFLGDASTVYRVYIHQPTSIEIDYDMYPQLAGLPSSLYFKAFTPPSVNYTLDSFGFGDIALTGYNTIQLPYSSEVPLLPLTELLNSSHFYGFNTYPSTTFLPSHVGGVDCSSLFEFYDNVDEIPTP